MNAIVLVEAEVKTQLFAAPLFNELGTLWGQTAVTLCIEEAGARKGYVLNSSIKNEVEVAGCSAFGLKVFARRGLQFFVRAGASEMQNAKVR